MENQQSLLASDYRSEQTVSQIEASQTQENPQTMQTQTATSRSYTNAVKTHTPFNFPKKNQAILLNAIDDFKLTDYVIAVGNIVGPNNITFASRIANNRICIYLSSVQIVDKLLQQQNTLLINDVQIGIRRLITPAKRIIISNVCPSVPHDIISNLLKNLGLNIVSPVTFLRAGIQGDNYGHVFSFRRQVYVSPPENELFELPSSTVINFEDTTYRVFLTFDELTCFVCKKNGHIAKNCPNTELVQTQTKQLIGTRTDLDENLQTQTPAETLKRHLPSSNTSEHDGENKQLIDLSPTPEQRTEVPKITFSQPNPVSSSQADEQKCKKLKKSTSVESKSIREMLEPAKLHIQKNPSEYILPHETFVSFIENTKGSNDILSEAQRYTSNIEELIKMIYDLYPKMTERSIKSRFTNVIKKLKRQIRSEKLETSSNISLSSVDHQDTDQDDEMSF